MMSSPGRTAEAVGDCAARAAAAPSPELTQGTAISGPDSRHAPLGSRIRQRGPAANGNREHLLLVFHASQAPRGEARKMFAYKLVARPPLPPRPCEPRRQEELRSCRGASRIRGYSRLWGALAQLAVLGCVTRALIKPPVPAQTRQGLSMTCSAG